MDKSNLELFKQAISEGLSAKFDSVVASCTDEIVCSDKHKLAMRAIVYGKTDGKHTWSPRIKRLVAILVAAALLLTSCGIIFRNEIREVFEEFFVKLTYSDSGEKGDTIEEVYELTYLPDGYTLKKENIYDLCVTYKFVDNNSNVIIFEQRVLGGSEFNVDSESGYSYIEEIDGYDLYYRNTERHHTFIWSNGKYSFTILSNQTITYEEIVLIIDGIKPKTS